MAGVYIKGMKMPESCGGNDCPLTKWSCTLWKDIIGDHLIKRHKDCPLVEVPDHGDLIERDAVAYKVCEEIPCSECQFNEYPYDSCVLQTKLEEMPIIIHADKEGV